jgi:peptide/nickel transport system substrate-binding protein
VAEKIDQYGRREISEPTPFWADARRCGRRIIPKHLFTDSSATSRAMRRPTSNRSAPVYKFKDFKPGDLCERHQHQYHMENRPHFDAIEMKGGGDAVSAARGAADRRVRLRLENMQVEDEILQRLEKGGKGRVITGAAPSYIGSHHGSWTEVDGEREPQDRAPTLSDPAVRQALACWSTRTRSKFICGRTGGDGELHQQPESLASDNSTVQHRQGQRPPRQAGWAENADGIRGMDGKSEVVYQLRSTSRQKTGDRQQACQKATDIEVKAVTASVFFSSDVITPTPTHFYADLRRTITACPADPEVFLRQFCSWGLDQGNKWRAATSRAGRTRNTAAATKQRVRLDPVANRHAHQRRAGREQPGRDPRRRPTWRRGGEGQARRRAHRLGQQHVGSGELVQGVLRAPRRRMVIWSCLQ